MKEIYVSWEEYYSNIEKLANMIAKDEYNLNQIICIARGGFRPGDILSRMFKVPLAILSVESYKDQKKGDITFSRDLAKTTPNIGSRVLLVDDLADSGQTFLKSLKWVQYSYGFYINTIKTAALWHKKSSMYTPDYCPSYLIGDPWIHMPFEKYEFYDF